MVGEALAGLSAFKNMFDMARALNEIHDVTTRDRAVIDLQKEIITAQVQQSTLIERNSQLENELARLKAWEADKNRYQLQELPPGIFVRTLNPAMANGEPIHRLCTQCYDGNKKSILQNLGTINGQERLKCNGCGTILTAGTFQRTSPATTKPSSGGWT